MQRWAVRLRVAATLSGVLLGIVHCGDPDPGAGAIKLPSRPPNEATRQDGGPTLPSEGDAFASVTGDLACDPTKPFGDPSLVFDATQFSATPRLSHDELTIYFTATGQGTDLFRAVRSSRDARFGAPTPMTAQSSDAADNDPSVSVDHRTLFFHSHRSGNGELYTATRTSLADDFGPPSLVPNVNDPTANDAHAYYRSGGGGELWLVSVRGGSTTYRLHVAKRTANGFALPVLVAELSGDWNDYQPMISEDGRTLLFASDRPDGLGGVDLYVAKRASDAAPWSPPEALSTLNSPGTEFAGWISDDGCRIYFSSSRDTPVDAASPLYRVYTAARSF